MVWGKTERKGNLRIAGDVWVRRELREGYEMELGKVVRESIVVGSVYEKGGKEVVRMFCAGVPVGEGLCR